MDCMDPGKQRALIDWVNSTSVASCIESLGQLRDGEILLKIIKCMKVDAKPNVAEGNQEVTWKCIQDFLTDSHRPDVVATIEWHNIPNGNEFEIAKVVVLLLSMSICCSNKTKFISEMMHFDYESQVHIRHILLEVLAEKSSMYFCKDFFEILFQKAPSIMEQQELDITGCASPSGNSSMLTTTNHSMTSLNLSPTSLHNVSLQTGSRVAFCTPVRQIFKSLEEEEVYFSVPKSCPPLRRGASNPRLNGNNMQSMVNHSVECSPMREFLTSPVVNYKIRIKDLDQKICLYEKNLHAERVSKEECEKLLLEKEEMCKTLVLLEFLAFLMKLMKLPDLNPQST